MYLHGLVCHFLTVNIPLRFDKGFNNILGATRKKMKVCKLIVFRYIEFASSKKSTAVNLVLTFSQHMVSEIIKFPSSTWCSKKKCQLHVSYNAMNIDSITLMAS